MRYCFDLDDTICVHRDRDYPNAMPILDVIERMRVIKKADPDAYIIIHTSRGMNSCKGNITLADERNRSIIEEWLRKYNVPYDEIIFGKPLADVYVDDKAIPAFRFESGCVQRYKGFSGASVMRVADIVIKHGDKTAYEYEWYLSDEKAGFLQHFTPVVFSYTLGKLYIQYIDGTLLSDVLRDGHGLYKELLHKAQRILEEFSSHRIKRGNDVDAFCQFINERGRLIDIDTSTLCERIRRFDALREATFNHGDFTPLNIIVNNLGLYLIDPSVSPISSWLLDAAKFRASLNGLDAAITNKDEYDKSLVEDFDGWFPEHIGIIRLLEKTHYVRVMYYAKKLGNELAFQRLKKLYES